MRCEDGFISAVHHATAGETIYSATFAVAWNAFVLFWTLSAASLMLSLFSLPFWAAGFMMGKCVANWHLPVLDAAEHCWAFFGWSVSSMEHERMSCDAPQDVCV